MEVARDKNQRKNILMVGPYPPDVGGISNFMYNMDESKVIKKHFSLDIFITRTRGSNTTFVYQTLIEIRQFFRFLFQLKVKNYNLVHINTASFISFYRSFLFLFVAKKFFDTKCILHIHGGKFIEFYVGTNTLLERVIDYAFKISDLLIVTSPSWVLEVKKILKTDKKIEIIFNGFKKEQFHPMDQTECRKMFNLPENKKIILSIGNLISEKNHLLLIKAINKIIRVNEKKDLFCIIIGDGPLRNVIKDSIRDNNLEHLIINISNVPHEEIPYWINASDMMILPSTHEGNPTVMFECLACGKPFVGTKVGGIPDIISSEDYGFLVKPKDINDLTEKISNALNKDWNKEVIIEYSKFFSWRIIGKKLANVYNDLLNGNKSA